MPPKEIVFETKYLKTYATMENLQKAIRDFPDRLRYVVCRTPENRYFPLFTNSISLRLSGALAHNGFAIVG